MEVDTAASSATRGSFAATLIATTATTSTSSAASTATRGLLFFDFLFELVGFLLFFSLLLEFFDLLCELVSSVVLEELHLLLDLLDTIHEIVWANRRCNTDQSKLSNDLHVQVQGFLVLNDLLLLLSLLLLTAAYSDSVCGLSISLRHTEFDLAFLVSLVDLLLDGLLLESFLSLASSLFIVNDLTVTNPLVCDIADQVLTTVELSLIRVR